jgi:tetratricopeptide (TPR) repeat protein
MKLFNLNKRKAQKYHEKGQFLSDEGKDLDAIEMYQKAIELDPEKSESFYNIGLIYKYRNEWKLSLEYNKKANELNPDDEAARWNLAIAATALRNWDIARSAWKQNGFELEGDAGPINMNFGMTPIRLNPEGDAEVVWATRIDPVRAIIDSVPHAESGFKYGDVVLHDGAAVGFRRVREREYPVFNVLELFESSNYKTSTAMVEISTDDDLKELDKIFSATPHEFEDWTSNIRNLCRQCSEGRPHEHHDNDMEKRWRSERTLGLAIYNSQNVMPLFDDWQNKTKAKLLTLESGDES